MRSRGLLLRCLLQARGSDLAPFRPGRTPLCVNACALTRKHLLQTIKNSLPLPLLPLPPPCRHLVVAKSMTRLANLLMQHPPDPSAPQLAPHFASSAVAIAENALQVGDVLSRRMRHCAVMPPAVGVMTASLISIPSCQPCLRDIHLILLQPVLTQASFMRVLRLVSSLEICVCCQCTLQGAQRANLWSGMLRGALRAVSSSSAAAKASTAEAERCSERLLAALQLGNACLALAAAEGSNGRPGDAAAALRTAVGQLRWVLAAGGEDLSRLGATHGVEVGGRAVLSCVCGAALQAEA